MKKYLIIVLLIPFFTLPAFAQMADNPLQYVNPFIGTDYHGHVFLGASTPFGAIQLGPSNISRGWDWCSGYHYSSREILGFTHTHLSGTGIGDWNDVLLLPATGEELISPAKNDDLSDGYGSLFQHSRERCTPGFYGVHLDRYGIDVRLTTTDRAGMHEYEYSDGDNPHIVLDMSFAILWNKPVENEIRIINDSTILGHSFTKGWASDQRVFVAFRIQNGLKSYKLFQGGGEVGDNTTIGLNSVAVLYPNLDDENKAKIKVGISYVSAENALVNLDKEVPSWSLDKILDQTQNKWKGELAKVEIKGSKEVKTKYYTAMYHTYFFPALFQDVDGRYRAADMSIKQDAGYTNYTLFSLWDTYRAFHPWMSIIQPARARDFVISMLNIYRDQGKLPVWHLSANETNTMIGLPAIPVVSDALQKGLLTGYEDQAYKAMIHSSMGKSEGLDYVNRLQYIPADSINEATAKGLEYAIADAALARAASQLGNTADADAYTKRSELYRTYFDTGTGFMRGRMADGSFRAPFDPVRADHRTNDYCEGNGWQYTWLVPQDVPGLISMLGGEKKFTDKLDRFFTTKGDLGENASADISGLIGQYAQGNEPNHHIIYLYNFAGKQWKTALRARQVMDTFYTTKVDGLCGNEDAGQMSAWYNFSALGFYPVNAANGVYVIGSPEVDGATINLENGKKFELLAMNNSSKNIYIQKITWNGVSYEKSYLTHDMIMQGGKLVYFMGDKPNKSFGSKVSNRPQ